MRLIDLAKKCGAEIKEIVRTIEVQFHEALPHEPNIHVPDQYISRILYMYETLQPHLFNKGYMPEDDGDKATMLQSSTPDLERSIETSTDAKDINEEISIPQCHIVPIPETEPLLDHNILSPAKTFGSGNDQLIKLYKIARDLNISVFTIVEAFNHVFQGNTNPNSRVSRNLAIQIYNYFGKEYNDANEITAPNCNSTKGIKIASQYDDATECIAEETFYNDNLRTLNNEVEKRECLYSIAKLSLRMGIAEGRVRNMLDLFGYSDNLGSYDEIITPNHWERIIGDYNSVSSHPSKSNREGKHLQRITALGLNSLNKLTVIEDLQLAYDSHQITKAKITSINSGGYVMTSIGRDYNVLFCPYSHSVASISGSKFCKRLIGSSWLVEVKSNPSENNGNVIVSARLNKEAYSGIVNEGGFYEAFICNCTEFGAYVLIEKCVPMFIPNKLISWKNRNNAQTDLKPGTFVIVKIIIAVR